MLTLMALPSPPTDLLLPTLNVLPIGATSLLQDELILDEGQNRSVYCGQRNWIGFDVETAWLNPSMTEISKQVLRFVNVNRRQAGNYTCVLTANTGQNITTTLKVVVNRELSFLTIINTD
jgi:hypothetical protein